MSRKWLRIFKALSIDSDCEWEFIDGSYVKAHQHSAGAASEESQAEGQKPCRQYHKDPFGGRWLWFAN
ncbi:hypothetical protein NMYAN_260018 [Nitrosomonas nitrosa]|uniref:Transposase n=1 Tax=Nitrosomonas nitrosa TaxID=52442 RepID=A0A8H9DBM4_9PROT|nr:hypothetical protein NMYAN_260018 [Nitrosomonas nitrosa]